jgi:Asp-tRNA(Asn)/Glu-tRNA(Gln) amidotransferase A subunit family amidase
VKKETSVEQSKPAGGTADNVRVSRRALLGGASALAAGGALTVTGGGIARAATRTPAKSVPPPSVSVTTSRAAALKDSSFLPSLNSIRSRKNLVDYEVVELAAMLRAGKVSSVELTQAYLDRISTLNGPFETYGNTGFYNAFVRINAAQALAAAAAADKALAAARRNGPPVSLLCGIPMGIKDSVGIKGFSTQDGSPTFAGNVALNDATIVGKLRAAGVVLIGNTICSAFSGSITGTFAGNAWNPLYVPGGSSQGSGVAPIARLAAACIGEETGGSITMPSAANGASGIKPSLGTVSIAGLMPLSPGYDVLGPISRSGRDSALILNAILGPDPFNDPQTLAAPDPFPLIPMTPRLGGKPLQGTTIGVPQTDWMIANGQVQTGVSPQSTYGAGHLAVFNRLVNELESLGAKVIEFPGLDMTDFSVNPYFSNPDVLETVDGSSVTPSTAAVNTARYEVRYADAVSDFCASGIPSASSVTTLTSQYGRRAPGAAAASFASADTFNGGISTAARFEGEQRRRTLINNYAAALNAYNVDFMLIFSLGDVIGQRTGGSGFPVQRAYYQVPNALGWPLVSFPVGYVQGLPVSAQFWGPRFTEPELTQAMIDYQARFPDYNTVFPTDPVLPVATTAPSASPSASVKPNADLVAPGAAAPSGHGVDEGLSNDPLVGEAQLKAMMNL